MDNNPIWLNDELGDIANEKGKQPTYTAQSGDNLTKIAKKYNTTVEQITKWNNIKDPDKIKVGQVLKVGPAPSQNSKPKPKTAGSDNSVTLKGQKIVADVETQAGGVQLSSTNTIKKGNSNITTTVNINTKKITSTSLKLSNNTKITMSTSGDLTFGNNYYQVGNTKNGGIILNINIPTTLSSEPSSTYNVKLTVNPEPFIKMGEIIKHDVDYLFKWFDNSQNSNGIFTPPWFYYAIP